MTELRSLEGGLADVLGAFRRKGVILRAENGRLHYRVGRGALSRDDLATLAQYKDQILALFERTHRLDVEIRPRERSRDIPLTYSQLAHWRRYGLSERLHLRQIASATRLVGRFNPDALRSSLAEMLRRHEALRIRIEPADGAPTQRIAESTHYELEIADLTKVPDALLQTEARRRIERYVAQPVDVARGPLFGAKLLRLRDHEHILVVAMEHMISDGISLGIVVRDLLCGYEQAASGRCISLPQPAVQFADYAVWQRSPERAWIEENARYWRERLTSCGKAQFPDDRRRLAHGASGWADRPVHIDGERLVALRDWCRLNGVTLPMSVFGVYAILVLRWCNARRSVIRYVTGGRFTPALEQTVGYFASLLFLRVELHEGDTLLDVVRHVTEEYCSAQERPHLGCIESQTPLPSFARGCGFNWVPQGGDRHFPAPSSSTASLVCSPVPFDHPMLKTLEQDIDPFALFYDTPEGLIGTMNYACNRFAPATIDRFVHNFLLFIDALTTQPRARAASMPLA